MSEQKPQQQLEDVLLTCRDCGGPFTWTAGEQQFYASKGFTERPKRCKRCRAKRKLASDGRGNADEHRRRDGHRW